MEILFGGMQLWNLMEEKSVCTMQPWVDGGVVLHAIPFDLPIIAIGFSIIDFVTKPVSSTSIVLVAKVCTSPSFTTAFYDMGSVSFSTN